MKRLLLSAAFTALLLVPAGAAQAKFAKGFYSGQAAGGGSQVSFEVTGRAVKHLAFDNVKVHCTDQRDRFASQRDSSPFRIAKSGKFQGQSGAIGFAVTFEGKVKKGKATGKLRVVYRTTEDGSLSETGPITCDSGDVSWKATTSVF